MKTISLNLYTFDELTPEAQEKATNDYNNSPYFQWAWSDENIETIRKALAYFNYRLNDYTFDPFGHSSISIAPNNIHKASKIKDFDLEELVEGDCPFTGYYLDEVFCDPLRDYTEKPTATSLDELLKKCVALCVKAIEEEMLYQTTKEYFAELSEGNDYTFEADGTMRNE